jgi:addiction module HigA family antidote
LWRFAGIALDFLQPGTAAALGISLAELEEILAECAQITPKMAARFGKLCGAGAGIWIRMQAAHDAWHAEREVDAGNESDD